MNEGGKGWQREERTENQNRLPQQQQVRINQTPKLIPNMYYFYGVTDANSVQKHEPGQPHNIQLESNETEK